MADNNLQIIKERLNIVDIVGEKVMLKKRGKNFFGICPFHQEKNPSFSVNEDLQIFKCFGCGRSGDIFTFVEEFDHVDFKEALEILAKKANVDVSSIKFDSKYSQEKQEVLEMNELASKVFEYCLSEMSAGEQGRNYAKERGLTPELIKKFRVGYAPASKDFLAKFLIEKKGHKPEMIVKAGLAINKNGEIIDKFRSRLIFPVHNNVGEIVAFSGRYFEKVTNPDFTPPKYLNSPETSVFHKSKVLYGLYQAKESISKQSFVIISEGQMNIISSHKAGIENIVASLGTSLTLDHLKILNRYTNNILFCFDKDSAGNIALRRSLLLANQLDLTTRVVTLQNGKDPDEEIKADMKKWIADIEDAKDAFEYLIETDIKKFSLSSNESKLNIVKDLKDYLLSVQNPVKKELYINTLSAKLSINIETINRYLSNQKIVLPKQPQKEEVINIKINKNNIEEYFLALVFQNWVELRPLLNQIDATYFSNEKYANILVNASFAGTDNIEEFINTLDADDQNIVQEAILRFLSLDENVHLEKEFLFSYRRIKEKFIQNNIRELKKQKAESDENNEEVINELGRLTSELQIVKAELQEA